jgi:hypothetical protein
MFVERCRYEGFTHVLMLSGTWITCALKDDIALLHLIDWKSSIMYCLFDTPDRDVSPGGYIPRPANRPYRDLLLPPLLRGRFLWL